VKRLLALTVALPLAAVLFIPSAGAQTATPSVSRANPLRVTLTVTPRRDRRRPFTFTSRGRVIPPGRYCNPGENPQAGRGCIPILCPPGATTTTYCLFPGRRVICSGTVTVRFQKRRTTISSRRVALRPNCTYRSKVSFDLPLTTRRGIFRVRARFSGNVLLNPRYSATRTVRAG
jgi:hypothetical protein